MSSFQLSDGRGLLQAAGPAEDGVLTALNQQGCREAVKVQQSYMQTHKHTDTHTRAHACMYMYVRIMPFLIQAYTPPLSSPLPTPTTHPNVIPDMANFMVCLGSGFCASCSSKE